jgi:hypothetical protein
MATLFFEGFDRGTTFNKLDSAYWSSQFSQFPKYAFGGYTTNAVTNTNASIGVSYTYCSPNNGILPSGTAQNIIPSYPGFGTPAGFLALSNIEVESNTVEYPTYLQLSGFSPPSGDKTYFGFRSLGLESKHIDYSNYPHRHLLCSLCSGNITGLVINIVKVTGETLLEIAGEKTTLGLEIQQNNQTIGIFDLNIAATSTRYQVIPILQTGNKILTVADTNTNNVLYRFPSQSWSRLFISRWLHSEFLIDNEDPEQSYLSIRAEGVELSIINNDTEVSRQDWELELPISGFSYNNIKFYNRTYSSSIVNTNGISFGYDYGYIQGQESIDWTRLNYYTTGKTLLLDDITLIDNTDAPAFWLGPTVRVLPLVPAINGDIRDNSGRNDGLKDWSSNSYARYGNNAGDIGISHRKAFLFLDGDTNSITTINSGNIDAVAFGTRNLGNENVLPSYLRDDASLWRETFSDGIGGMKVYNNTRKSYLDTKYINVFRSGITDQYEGSVSLLLRGESSPIIDNNSYGRSIYPTGSAAVSFEQSKFGSGSLYFPNANSYIYLDHPDIEQYQITIESWVYFTNSGNKISFFDKTKMPPNAADNGSYKYTFDLDISGIIYSGANRPTINRLYFPEIATTGVWHHVALVKDSSYRLICYLNGVSGVDHSIFDNPNNESNEYNSCETTGIFTNKLYTIPDNCSLRNITSNFSRSGDGAYIPGLLTIGKGGYLDNYRISYNLNRYPGNFDVPTESFKIQRDEYIEIGPITNVNKTTYRTTEYYANHNPATDQNWTVPQITGLIFGVKKL